MRAPAAAAATTRRREYHAEDKGRRGTGRRSSFSDGIALEEPGAPIARCVESAAQGRAPYTPLPRERRVCDVLAAAAGRASQQARQRRKAGHGRSADIRAPASVCKSSGLQTYICLTFDFFHRTVCLCLAPVKQRVRVHRRGVSRPQEKQKRTRAGKKPLAGSWLSAGRRGSARGRGGERGNARASRDSPKMLSASEASRTCF